MLPTVSAWRAVLFDLDGTLIDSIGLILDSFAHTLARCGLPDPGAAVLRQGLGIPLASFFGRWTRDPTRIAVMIDVYREHNLASHDARIRAFPGVADMVHRIRTGGLATALVTSKNRAASERGLAVAGLGGTMDVLVTCDDVTRPKPDREPVDRALALLGVGHRVALLVGDSLYDLECGRAAGVTTVAALWGPFTREELAAGRPDHWATSPSDVVSLLDGPSGWPNGRRSRVAHCRDARE